MIWTILGWITVVWIVLTAIGVNYWIWRATRRPWMSLYPDVPVPKISATIDTYTPDNPFPWI